MPRSTAVDRVCAGIGWAAFASAPVALAIGHAGARFNWRTTHISVYAAKAPHDDWVTATMVLGVVAVMCLALRVVRSLRPLWCSGPIALLLCVAAGGLGLLAYYELGAATAAHNRGLVTLLTAAPLALSLAGLLFAVTRRRWAALLVPAIALLGVAVSFLQQLMLRWHLSGFPGRGVSQRGGFICLWLAAMLLFSLLASNDGHASHAGSAEDRRDHDA